MRTRFALNLEEVERMIDAAMAEAARERWPVSIAIVDDYGIPIVVVRMDEASAMSPATAIEKARSAAVTGLPTKMLEAMVGERPAVATIGRVAVEGGLPILFQGQRVGGIGVSGVQSEQDAQVAEAGLKAIANLLGAP